jgi:hypothetical protein
VFDFARKLAVFAALASVFVLVGPTLAASGKMQAHPDVYNPGAADVEIVAKWRTHAGLADAGRSNHGLILSMSEDVAYPPGANAGATIVPVEGDVLESLSLDHEVGTLCGGGAPRWLAVMTDGSFYGITCDDGTHTPIAGTDWEHISWSCTNPTAAVPLGGGAGCAFGKTLVYLAVIVDIAGSTTIDNLEVNGCVMGKPGNC